MGLKRQLSTCIRVLSLSLALALPLTFTPYRSVSAESVATPSSVSDFSLKDLSGHDVKLSSLGGKAYVIDVWATWCPPCKEEIPCLIDLQKKYGDKGLRIVGVAVDDDGVPVVKPFVESHNLNYTVCVASQEQAARLFGDVSSIPTTLFVDANHKVRQRFIGYHSPNEMEQSIKTLLGGTGK